MTGLVSFTNATAATSTSTGSVVVAGGIGIGGNLWVGGTLNAAGASTLAAVTANGLITGSAGVTTNTLTVTGVSSFTSVTFGFRSVTGSPVLTSTNFGKFVQWAPGSLQTMTLPSTASGATIRVILLNPTGGTNSTITGPSAGLLRGTILAATGTAKILNPLTKIIVMQNSIACSTGDTFDFYSDGSLWYVRGFTISNACIGVA